MSVTVYALLAYGAMAVIAFAVVGVIVLIDRLFSGKGKDGQ